MSCRFNSFAPIHYGLTCFTVCSVSITRFSACSILAENSKFCVMYMIGRRNCCQRCRNVDCTAKTGYCFVCKSNLTVYNIAIDVYNGLIAHVGRCIGSIGHIIVTVKCPYAYGNAYESVIKRFCFRSVNKFNCNCKKFGDFVVSKSSFETICHNRAIRFPFVCIVQLDLCYKFSNICKICYVNINIVDGLCHRCYTGIIMAAERYNSITRNSKCSCDLCRVAKFILDFKCYSMRTCNKNNIFHRGKCIACNSCLNFNTVNIDLTCCEIKSGVVSYSCRECNLVTVNRCSVIKRNGRIGSRVSGICNSGKYSVVNSRAVVESNVINVESNLIRCIRFYICTNERRRTGVTFVSCNGCAEIIVFGNIDSCIYPTGFGNICICCRVQVGLFTCCSRSEHKVILLAGVRTVRILYIELRLECKTFAECIITATSGGECILRNIDPHTKSRSLHTVCNVTKNDGFTNVEENVVRPACEGCIGIVKSPCESIVAVSNLTTVCQGRNKCLTAEVLIELTCKRR